MSIIHILEPLVANQIAAGEVVERPASIVKELVENSLDAGATSITVEISGGGIESIRVTDNGHGMDKVDAEKAFLRHATSKIKKADDLHHIATMGFRGEALASIAAVSHVELTTRQKGADEGTFLHIAGGEIYAMNAVGCPDGTSIVVRDIFYNTPARLKFLKKPNTEAAAIADLVARLILANPNIAIKYINNRKVIYHCPGNHDLSTAIYCIYGAELLNALQPVTYKVDSFNITGFVGLPEDAKTGRAHQTVIVNGRYVRCFAITASVEDVYDTRMMVGKHPFFVLHMQLPQEEVDVNVHPGKMEVKFQNEYKVRDFVRRGVHMALYGSDGYQVQQNKATDVPIVETSNAIFSNTSKQPNRSEIIHQLRENMMSSAYESTSLHQKNVIHLQEPMIFRETQLPFTNNIEQAERSVRQQISEFIFVGKLFNTYLLFQKDANFYMIDQHAAHERLLYEKYKNAMVKHENYTQTLMEPLIIRISPTDMDFIDEYQPLLRNIGFDIEEFGVHQIRICTAPYMLSQIDIKAYLDDLLTRIQSFKSLNNEDVQKEMLIQMACKKAIKAGDALSQIEIDELMQLLQKENVPLTCPHGRPILISMTQYEIEKKFRRV